MHTKIEYDRAKGIKLETAPYLASVQTLEPQQPSQHYVDIKPDTYTKRYHRHTRNKPTHPYQVVSQQKHPEQMLAKGQPL